ncbi:DUF2063 domain-containing protein [Flavobacterium sp. '19STA2R22 D10 B1']|uniref:HvfC/BufC N-terminal domain-containing protein n=1 Tax=Flavobacterium aerium TaxID=3037261 RepID=UPI00278C788E|nr:putative DNA-binding domain-containing protein [Flavobacterium sp. '19STA2R22 D10 B1']
MLRAKTHQYQSDLANFCRSGNYQPIPGVKEDNIVHYRRLVFNNVMDSLTAAYPLTKKLFGKRKWEKSVQRFFESYAIQSPQIWYMPKEYKEYVIQHEKKMGIHYPFLADLLEFEWLEIEVFMMPDVKMKLEEGKELYYINPEMRIVRMDYPVHLKNAKSITRVDKGDYFMTIHRNPDTGSVQFTNISIPFVDVIENLMEKPLSLNEILFVLLQYADLETAQNAFLQFEKLSVTNQLIYKS